MHFGGFHFFLIGFSLLSPSSCGLVWIPANGYLGLRVKCAPSLAFTFCLRTISSFLPVDEVRSRHQSAQLPKEQCDRHGTSTLAPFSPASFHFVFVLYWTGDYEESFTADSIVPGTRSFGESDSPGDRNENQARGTSSHHAGVSQMEEGTGLVFISFHFIALHCIVTRCFGHT